jgi:hypothetical protein
MAGELFDGLSETEPTKWLIEFPLAWQVDFRFSTSSNLSTVSIFKLKRVV